jgi:hypothetical protein
MIRTIVAMENQIKKKNVKTLASSSEDLQGCLIIRAMVEYCSKGLI